MFLLASLLNLLVLLFCVVLRIIVCKYIVFLFYRTVSQSIRSLKVFMLLHLLFIITIYLLNKQIDSFVGGEGFLPSLLEVENKYYFPFGPILGEATSKFKISRVLEWEAILLAPKFLIPFFFFWPSMSTILAGGGDYDIGASRKMICVGGKRAK